ncbi:MAG TPA: hypothetical protein VEK34_06815 [Methylocella sp.]|nr:hypothetical protein [Methylocella sp.]
MKRAGSDICAIEQRFVTVLETDEIDIALEVRRLCGKMPEDAPNLTIDRFHRVRQQALDGILASLFGRESGSFVERGIVEEGDATR